MTPDEKFGHAAGHREALEMLEEATVDLDAVRAHGSAAGDVAEVTNAYVERLRVVRLLEARLLADA